METFNNIKKPSKIEQELAIESYDALVSVIDQLKLDDPEISRKYPDNSPLCSV